MVAWGRRRLPRDAGPFPGAEPTMTASPSPAGTGRPANATLGASFAARVIEAVREVAAREILPRFRTVSASRRKDDGSLVTEADLAVQHALASRLVRIEAVEMIGEEMPEAEQLRIWRARGRYWCVDPVDGTANFNAGVPYFAVSVALMEGDHPLFGAVYDPIADEAFHAVRGAGAWLNARALEMPVVEVAMGEAVAEVDLRRSQPRLRHALRDHAPYARRLTSGSSALSWCHLAAGRRDLFLHAGQRMWDYAAGALIAEEAGAVSATLEGDDFWAGPAWERSVIAARTPALFGQWRDWVRARAG